VCISHDLNIAAFDVGVQLVNWQKDIDAIVFADFKKAIFDWTQDLIGPNGKWCEPCVASIFEMLTG
jgi:hypothetical protein